MGIVAEQENLPEENEEAVKARNSGYRWCGPSQRSDQQKPRQTPTKQGYHQLEYPNAPNEVTETPFHL